MAHFQIKIPGVQLTVTDEPNDGSYSVTKDLLLDFNGYDHSEALTTIAAIFDSYSVGVATTVTLVDPA